MSYNIIDNLAMFHQLIDKTDSLTGRFNKIKYIHLSFITSHIHHKLQTSHIINSNLMYVGIGDTIFHSHYITGAGLARLFQYTKQICGLLPVLTA